MAQHVIVENYGSSTFSEEFEGETITLKPGDKINLARSKAVSLLSQMSAPGFVDENGSIDYSRPKEKKLRIISVIGETEKEYSCNLDGKKFGTQKELDAYLETMKEKNVILDDSGVIRKAK